MTKRTFFQTIGAGVSALRLVVSGLAAAPQRPQGSPAAGFEPIDCTPHFTASPNDLKPEDLKADATQRAPVRPAAGSQIFRGVPFTLGPGASAKSWIVLSTMNRPWSRARVEVPIGRAARFVCLAQFCDWDDHERSPAGVDVFEQAGQLLADAVFVYGDGSEERRPIRRRFEVNSLTYSFGHECFTAVPHRPFGPARLNDPLPNATLWGLLQTTVRTVSSEGDGNGTLWITSLENPSPAKIIRAIRFEAKAENLLAVCGLTLFHGQDDPLRWDRLSLYQITLPPGGAAGEWEVRIDLGAVARTYQLPEFESEQWLSSPVIGFGDSRSPTRKDVLYAEVTAAPGATLTLRNTKTGAQFAFDLARISESQQPGPARAEVVERERTWIRGRVIDASTGKPTPVRLAFRSREGRYIPPYGHRTDVNGGWFQDYGADLMRQSTPAAYVDGTFQVELPVGDVYVEITKGFEYEPVRRRLRIEAGQRELELSIPRFTDLRVENWASADTHVHFLSPSTAVLEGQAEGLNLINLLAAQWGDLFTNVGDLPHGHLTSRDGNMIVAVGTENRQHMLGHLGLLGGHGEPVFPMSADGPGEAYIGTPLWNTLAEWADACREREGLVVAAHFPYPTAELAADIVLGKIDAVEMQPRGIGEHFRSFRFLEWYRYLNCGYRLPAVGGTDKMNAWVAAGAFRCYAHLGKDEFSFENWAKAVRRGNTFMTSGPLLLFQAEGRNPGEEIEIRSSTGRVEVRATARSTIPVHRLEIVANGDVVASREEAGGAREIVLRESLPLKAPGWIAARCTSRVSYEEIQVAAHTSPIYLTVPGQDLFSAPVAAHLLTLMDGSESWIRKLAIRPDADRMERVLRVFADARNRLHQRMHQHGIPH